MDMFFEVTGRLGNVRSWDDLVGWFYWLPSDWQIFVGVCSFGLLVILYIFIVAIFMDKHN